MSERHCDTRHYWERSELNTETGFCHRYPPTVIMWDDDVTTVIPRTEDCDWCGEWKAKELTPPADPLS